MKRLSSFLLVLVILLVGSYGDMIQAAEQPTNNTVSLSPDDMVQLQKNVALFSKVLGMSDSTTSSTHLTMADVANKFLDYSRAAVLATVSQIEKVAPQVWAVMVRQQYSKAFGLLAGPFFMFFFFFFFRLWLVRSAKVVVAANGKENIVFLNLGDGDKVAVATAKIWINIILLGIMVIYGCVFGSRLPEAVKILTNPYYYALRDLVLLLLNKGQGM